MRRRRSDFRLVERRNPPGITIEPEIGWDDDLPPARAYRWRDVLRFVLRRRKRAT